MLHCRVLSSPSCQHNQCHKPVCCMPCCGPAHPHTCMLSLHSWLVVLCCMFGPACPRRRACCSGHTLTTLPCSPADQHQHKPWCCKPEFVSGRSCMGRVCHQVLLVMLLCMFFFVVLHHRASSTLSRGPRTLCSCQQPGLQYRGARFQTGVWRKCVSCHLLHAQHRLLVAPVVMPVRPYLLPASMTGYVDPDNPQQVTHTTASSWLLMTVMCNDWLTCFNCWSATCKHSNVTGQAGPCGSTLL